MFSACFEHQKFLVISVRLSVHSDHRHIAARSSMTGQREEQMRRVSVGVRTGIAISALALALSPVLALSAGASGGGWTPIGQGTNPGSLPGATAFGSTPSSTPETVS